MSISYIKKRNHFEVRELVDGKRTYIGSFVDRDMAVRESFAARIAESARQDTLENYKLMLEMTDKPITFLKPLRQCFAKLRNNHILKRADRLLNPKRRVPEDL